MLAGQDPVAQVFVCGSSSPLPKHTQNIMSRVRQVACSAYQAWFLLGTLTPIIF
jgi:hypothetical protein